MTEQTMSTSTAAKLWQVSDSSVRKYCAKYQKIIRAQKHNGKWRIPRDALPPAKLKDAKQFVQNYLKHINNPTEKFDWSACGSSENGYREFLALLQGAQIIEAREPNLKLDISNIRIIDKGWKLAFNQEKGMNKFLIALQPEFKIGFVNV